MPESQGEKGSGGGQGLQDILRAQVAHWSEGVSRTFRAIRSQTEEFEVFVFVQASERIPPDRGSVGSWTIYGNSREGTVKGVSPNGRRDNKVVV